MQRRLLQAGAPQSAVEFVRLNNINGDQVRYITKLSDLTAGGTAPEVALHMLQLSKRLRREQKSFAKLQITVAHEDGSTVEESFRDQEEFMLFLTTEGYGGLVDGTQEPAQRAVLRKFEDLVPHRVYAAHLGIETYATQFKLAKKQQRHKVEHTLEKELSKLAQEQVVLFGSELPLLQGKVSKGDLDSAFVTVSGGR